MISAPLKYAPNGPASQDTPTEPGTDKEKNFYFILFIYFGAGGSPVRPCESKKQ